MQQISYLPASWPERCAKPANVHAITTLKKGGFSQGDYSEYNLATHVGDELQAVKKNRAKLMADLALAYEPVWLEQVHSNKVITATKSKAQPTVTADASVTTIKGVVCAVLTADCLPVFFCNLAGTEVAVAHAGWRGLHAGIISNTVNTMKSSPEEILVSLGPAIGAQSFEVGDEVFNAFVAKDKINANAFVATTKGHYLCDIYQLARFECQSLGIKQVAGGEYCSYKNQHQFYSYRRHKNTGRMASLIWFS